MAYKPKDEASVSVLLFGMAVGTVASTLLNTQKGQQVLHDARSLFDDFAVLMDHVLDDNVSFEDGLAGLSDFNNHLTDKLNRVKAFESRPETGRVAGVSSAVVKSDQATNSAPKTPIFNVSKGSTDVFDYHVPVHSVKAVTVVRAASKHYSDKDEDVALLHKIGNRMFR